MNTAAPAGKEMAAHATDEAFLHRVSSKRNAAENAGLLCVGAALLTAAWGARDLGLATEATRTVLSAAVLAGAAFLFCYAIGSFLQREPQQQRRPPAPTTTGVRRKIETEQLDEPPPQPATSDRLSRSPSSKGPRSCDGDPNEATTAYEQPEAQEPMTPEPAAFRRTTRAYTKQQLGAQKQLTTPDPSPLRRTSRPRKPSRRYNTGEWVL